MQVSPVVSAVCDEPEGQITRHIYPMQLSPENLKLFWEKSRQFRTLFTTEINGDFQKFCELFISQEGDSLRSHGLFWVIDDFVGVVYIDRITTEDANCHYTFFDRRHKGREELIKGMLVYGFETFGFRRLNVEIPAYASKHTFGFVTALGFVKEGRKRSVALYRDQYYDVFCFGILRDEALRNVNAH